MIEKFEKLREEINNCKNDQDRYKVVFNNKDELKLTLDNDATFIEFINFSKYKEIAGEERAEDFIDDVDSTFDDYIGNAGGVFELLNFFGVSSDGV